MAAAVLPAAVRGWWRYSKLQPVPFCGSVVLAVLLWAAALLDWHLAAELIAAAATVLVVIQLVWGGVNAERARRFGCW